MAKRLCSKCERPHLAKGLCSQHYREANKERHQARRRELYHSNPETRARSLAATDAWRKSKGTYHRDFGREKRTGHSAANVARLLVEQEGKCAICQTQLIDNTNVADGLCADHLDLPDGSKLPRGLLCRVCNISLGLYEKRQRATGLILAPYETYLRKYE